jgi:Na+-driven multidrug efflux pump
MSAVLAGIIAILVFGNSRAMVAGMGAEPAVVPEGTRYLRVMVPGLFFMWIQTVLTGAMRGAGDMRTPMKVNIVASILSSLGNNRLSVSKAVASFVWFRTGR